MRYKVFYNFIKIGPQSGGVDFTEVGEGEQTIDLSAAYTSEEELIAVIKEKKSFDTITIKSVTNL